MIQKALILFIKLIVNTNFYCAKKHISSEKILQNEGLTIIPLQLYVNEEGLAKREIDRIK
jgi:tmRNA-binding protein